MISFLILKWHSYSWPNSLIPILRNRTAAHIDCKIAHIFALVKNALKSGQRKDLGWGWKRRVRLGRDAKNTFSTFSFLATHALRTCEAHVLWGKISRRCFGCRTNGVWKKNRLFCSLQLVRFLCKDYTSRDVKRGSCSTMIKLIIFFLSEQQLWFVDYLTT